MPRQSNFSGVFLQFLCDELLTWLHQSYSPINQLQLCHRDHSHLLIESSTIRPQNWSDATDSLISDRHSTDSATFRSFYSNFLYSSRAQSFNQTWTTIVTLQLCCGDLWQNPHRSRDIKTWNWPDNTVFRVKHMGILGSFAIYPNLPHKTWKSPNIKVA